MACKVSGNPFSDELFQGTLPISSCSPGQLVLRNKIRLILQSGMTFVLNKKFILELSAVILPTDNVSIGNHPMVSRFMKDI